MKPIPFLSSQDSHFPASLRTVVAAPDGLFYRALDEATFHSLLARPLVAIVGTRRMTAYGKMVIRTLVPPLVRAGAVIVSGLALGCDGEAHQTALDAQGGTIAVLGSGIDEPSIYPWHHHRLARDIIARGGALLSEFEPGTPSYPGNFPVRNRIIAGLCKATIVIEAEIKSGSLITAKFALEAGREVFAVPGPIMAPFSTGTNYLIQHGAHLVASASDILERLQLKEQHPKPMSEAAPDPLLDALATAHDFDAILAISGLAPSDLMTRLTMLELEGRVVRTGATWIRASR